LAQNLLLAATAFAKLSDARGIVTLRHPLTRLIAHKIAVKVNRRGVFERPSQENLASSRLQQISTAHDLGDLHFRIVYHRRKLIRGNIVSPPDDEVPEISPSRVFLRSQM
jgi:hypothetical protein